MPRARKVSERFTLINPKTDCSPPSSGLTNPWMVQDLTKCRVSLRTMKSGRILFLLLVIGLSTLSCRKTKTALTTATDEPVTVIAPLKTAFQSPADSVVLNFKELSGKMRVTATLNGRTQSFNTQIRWQKGQRIWLSMSILGIEGVRVLVTPDSVQYIDRLNSEYLQQPYRYLARLIKLDLPFESLERVLLGLPAFMDSSGIEMLDGASVSEWRGSYGNGIRTQAFFSKINNVLIEFIADDAKQRRNLITRYGDYRNIEKRLFPFERFMKFEQGAELMEMQVKFSEVSVSEGLSYPFDIPTKYKRID